MTSLNSVTCLDHVHPHASILEVNGHVAPRQVNVQTNYHQGADNHTPSVTVVIVTASGRRDEPQFIKQNSPKRKSFFGTNKVNCSMCKCKMISQSA